MNSKDWYQPSSNNDSFVTTQASESSLPLSQSFYQTFVSELSEEDIDKNLLELSDFMTQIIGSNKVAEEETLAALKNEVKSLKGQDRNPLLTIMQRLINLYARAKLHDIHPHIYKILIKSISIAKFELKVYCNEDVKQLGLSFWKQISSNSLQSFLKAFEIEDKINPEELLPKIQQLQLDPSREGEALEYIIVLKLQNHFDPKELIRLCVNQNKYKEAAGFAGKNFELQKIFIQEMIRTKNQSKAADYLPDFGKTINDFPELLRSMNQSSLRFLCHSEHWMKVEDQFCEVPETLIYQIEHLFNEGLFDAALSVVKRQNLLKHLAEIPDLLEEVQPYFTDPPSRNFSYIENDLFIKDDFKPTEEILGLGNSEGMYDFAKLQDFGIDPLQDVFYVDDVGNEVFAKATSDLLSSQLVGIDTEHRFNMNKFENWENALIQIANAQKIYLFDLLKIGENPLFVQFLLALLENANIIKIIQGYANDFEPLQKKYNLSIKSYFDAPTLFKAVYPDSKQTKLSVQTEKLFSKTLSKYEQISDWNRRPLRKAQLHYAAVDAFILIKIFEKLKTLIEESGNDINNYRDKVTGVQPNQKPAGKKK